MQLKTLCPTVLMVDNKVQGRGGGGGGEEGGMSCWLSPEVVSKSKRFSKPASFSI